MSQISSATTLPPGPSPVQASKSPVAQKLAEKTQVAKDKVEKAAESGRDHLIRMINYGVGGAGTVAGLVAVPHQIVQSTPMILTSVATIGGKATAFSVTRTGMLARLAAGVAVTSTSVSHGTEFVSGLASSTMKAPVVGRIFSPKVADVMTQKVLPVANAVGAGVAILDNGNRFYRAHQQGNTAGEVVAGTQIGLNAVSAVTGFIPGKAQWVFAGVGLASLGLELAHQFAGVGKAPGN